MSLPVMFIDAKTASQCFWPVHLLLEDWLDGKTRKLSVIVLSHDPIQACRHVLPCIEAFKLQNTPAD